MIETSRSLKELFHEARERASKALGFAKMLRKVRGQDNAGPLQRKLGHRVLTVLRVLTILSALLSALVVVVVVVVVL